MAIDSDHGIGYKYIMSKFNVSESIIKDTFIGRFLMEAVGDKSMPGSPGAYCLSARNFNNELVWDVKLTANGVELDFVEVLERYQQQWNDCLRRQAAALIEETFGLAISEIEDLTYKFKKQFLDMANKKLGLPIDDY